jgi:hypothetical protein
MMGDIKSERWARSFRNDGRDQSESAGIETDALIPGLAARGKPGIVDRNSPERGFRAFPETLTGEKRRTEQNSSPVALFDFIGCR